MKRWIFFVFTLLLLIASTAGCGRSDNPADNAAGDKLRVVTTIFPPYDFAREIAGDNAEVSMLLRPGSESHSFEPTPQDILKIRNSDVFIYVGGDSDDWVKKILESMDVGDTGKIKIVTLMDCVETVEEKIVEGMQEEAGEEEAGPEYDEHVWTSPRNAKLIVKKLSDVFSEADPENAAVYRNNAATYSDRLDQLDTAFQTVVAQAKRKTMIFADRFPFRYFADAYGLAYYAAFPGCSTETEASAATVAFLIDKVKKEKIPVVFFIEFSNGKMADTVCEATGAKKLLLHACHNISRDDLEGGASYLSLMRKNVENLKEALQ